MIFFPSPGIHCTKKRLFSWQCQNPCLLSLAFIIDWRVVATHLAPGSLFVSGKEVVFFEMEWPGFEPRASEEDALSTPPRPTWLVRTCMVHNSQPLEKFRAMSCDQKRHYNSACLLCIKIVSLTPSRRPDFGTSLIRKNL